jgi:hypothetical protein
METEAFDSSYPGLPGQDHSEEFRVSSEAEFDDTFGATCLPTFRLFLATPCKHEVSIMDIVRLLSPLSHLAAPKAVA